MQNEKLFMKMLQEIVEVARVNGNSITTKEVDEYFSDLSLDEKQTEAIYEYLCKGHIKVIGYTNLADASDGANIADTEVKEVYRDTFKSDKELLDSVRTKYYRKTVKDLGSSGYSVDEIFEMYSDLNNNNNNNNNNIREIIINAYLPVVLNYVSRYAGKGVASDELIQEGNLALIIAVDSILSKDNVCKIKNAKEFDNYLRENIRAAVISTVDTQIEDESELQAAVGKAQLVKEAAAHLSKELGRVASLRELSEYTHISEDEIEDIIRFSGNVVSLGDGNDMSK